MSTELREAFKIVQNDFQTALKMTRKGFSDHVIKSNNKHWYLVLGLPNAGKSNLFNIAGTEFDFTVQHAVSELCEYWHLDEAVFIDVNSKVYADDTTAEQNLTLLNKLFTEFKKNKIAPSGIIITAPIQELENNLKHYDQQSHYIQENIKHLNRLFPGIAVSIVATKADLIVGFNEFFDDLGPEERAQSCGIQFPAPPYDQSLPELCDDAFARLLKSFHDRLLARVHQEPDLAKKHLINDFPMQVELLKPHLGHLLNQLLPSIEITLNGIYFTSILQTTTPINHIAKPLKEVFDLQPINQLSTVNTNKAFFVKGLFENFIGANKNVVVSKSANALTYVAAVVAITSIIGGTTLYKNYQANRVNIQAANQLLQRAENNTSVKAYSQVLAKLYALQQTYNAIKADQNTYTHAEQEKHQQLLDQSQEAFWEVLQKEFFVELSNTLDQELEHQLNQKESDPMQLFKTLGTYLMLHDPVEFNQGKVLSWFVEHWKTQPISITSQLLLKKYLELLSTKPLPQQKINFTLMLHAQETLKEQTPIQIAVRMLSKRFYSQAVKVLDSDVSLVLDKNFNTIDSLYTKAHWQDVNQQIQEVSHTIAQYLWTIDDTSVDEQSLTAKLQEQYSKHYVQHWQIILQHIQYQPHHHFNDYLVSINLLNSTRSPLKQLLQKVYENTSELPDDPQFNTLVSSQFNEINSIAIDDPNLPLNRALDHLAKQMNAIGNAKDPISTAYARARLRINNSAKHDALTDLFTCAKTLPQPLQQWANSAADDGWRLILAGAKTYLNAVWTQFVLPEYNNSIKDKFPVFNQANNDISFENFSVFFAPNGVMDTFYNNYMADFVDEQHGWQWRTTNNRGLDISGKTLEQFIRALMIQKMFFAHNHTHPQIEFSMHQTALNPRVKEFSLLVDSTTVEYQKDPKQLTNISWPGNGISENQMRFENMDGKVTKLDFNDNWGWFRVMDLAEIKPTKDTKKVSAIFKFAGVTIAQYLVSSNSMINPFSPDIISAFRCPSRL